MTNNEKSSCGNGWSRWKRCLPSSTKHLLLALSLCGMMTTISTTKVEAQEATITINGYAYGMIAGIEHECPIRPNGRVEGYVGMSVSCPIYATDSDGNFTPSTISATPFDSTRLVVRVTHVAQDTLGNFAPDTLHINVIRKGNWHLDVFANPLLFIMGFMNTRTEDATWARYEFPPIRVLVDEVFVLCAYEGGYEDAVAKSLARPVPCPDLGDTPLPEFDVEWTLPDILGVVDPAAVPGSVMAALNENINLLGVRHLKNSLHSVPLTRPVS